MYQRSAPYYEAIYAWKDGAAESGDIREIVASHGGSAGRRLLDVAAGTGRHLEHLKGDFDVVGLDLSDEMLELARERLPQVTFHHADMRTFDLGEEFDVVTCLFAAIGYALDPEQLHATWARFAAHLAPGGIAIVEPWVESSLFRPGLPTTSVVDEPELKIARLCTSQVDGDIAVMDMHYVVATTETTEHFVEQHRLYLSTDDEMHAAIVAAGLTAIHVPGVLQRGAWIGRRDA